MHDAPGRSADTGVAGQRLRYREVAAAIDLGIASGAVPVGSRLPSEASLADEHGVARGTVRKALATLQRRGVVAPQRGAGWVVQSPARAYGLAGFRSFAQWARSRGLEPGGTVVESRDAVADAALARRMRIPVGDPVLHVTRVRTLDGQRVMVERSSYPSWVADVVRAQPVDAPSVATALSEAGFAEAEGSHRLDAIAASSEDARLLGVPRSSPLMQVDRRALGVDGRTIDVSDDRYLPGSVTFEVRSDGR